MAPDADTFVFEWFPARLLQKQPRAPAKPHASVVLNQPLTNLEPFEHVWQSTQYRVAADGGANQLFKIIDSADPGFRDLDVIIGDLDSLTDEVRQFFATPTDGRKATEVIHDSDQYSTDFTKAVKLVRQRFPEIDVVALGGLGGRVDQGISQLHHLYLFDERRQDASSGPYRIDWVEGHRQPASADSRGRTFLLTGDSLAFLLLPGRHRIHVREKKEGSDEPTEEVFAKHIGILPMQGPSIISTSGLEWDVTDWPTEFGGQISTSNHVLPDTQVVEVTTNRSVVFTIALKEEWRNQS